MERLAVTMKTLFRNVFLLFLCVCLLPIFLPSLSVSAESSEGTAAALPRLYEACMKLLSGYSSLIVEGQADLELDGILFKHAEGLLVQDGTRSYQQIELQTPRGDGSFRENGYAVVDLNGSGYTVEWYGGRAHISSILNVPKEHPLRSTVSSDMLLKLGQRLAEAVGASWHGPQTLTASESGVQILLSCTEDEVPPLADAGLNLFWQALVSHFFEIRFPEMSPDGYASIEDYATIREGIVYCVRELALKEIRLSASLDPEDHLLRLDGAAGIRLFCRDGSERLLTTSFALSGRDYGTAVLEDAIPMKNRPESLSQLNDSREDFDAFFNTAAHRGIDWAEEGLPPIPFPEERLLRRDITSREDAIRYAGEICSMGCFSVENLEAMEWDVEDSDIFTVIGSLPGHPEEPVVWMEFNHFGELLLLENLGCGLKQAEPFVSDQLDQDPVVEWRSEIGLYLWRVMENLYPGSTLITAEEERSLRSIGMGFTTYHETLSSGDASFVVFYGTLRRDPYDKVKLVVQTEPVFRLVVLDSLVDPEEGGNG